MEKLQKSISVNLARIARGSTKTDFPVFAVDSEDAPGIVAALRRLRFGQAPGSGQGAGAPGRRGRAGRSGRAGRRGRGRGRGRVRYRTATERYRYRAIHLGQVYAVPVAGRCRKVPGLSLYSWRIRQHGAHQGG